MSNDNESSNKKGNFKRQPTISLLLSVDETKKESNDFISKDEKS